ncbi:MAG: TPM domain-containing protein [Bacteroidales bacterium]|nr:TPM domain-containing protein [Bacteroidales bacterium]
MTSNKKTNNSCKLAWISGLLLLLFVVSNCYAQQIPSRPTPPRLVNDFTNTLTKTQENGLEQKLVAYNDSTSTQIAVVFVDDLQGTTAADFAYQLGEKWGVGTKENNGIVILVKPKNDTKGEVFISVGYGLEPYIPDAIAKRIIENEMIPSFKENDYYHGVDKAVDIIIGLVSGAFTADEYSVDEGEIFILVFFIIMTALMCVFISLAGKMKTYSSKHDDSSIWKALFWASVFSNSNRHNHHSHWNDFSGGSGGFGGGFGGGSFGGFGGGSFGGGGAGGSW